MSRRPSGGAALSLGRPACPRPCLHGCERHLIAMPGEQTNWVRNARANGGRAVLRQGRRRRIRWEEVPVEQRGLILRRYLDIAPGARPHFPATSPSHALVAQCSPES
jgi:hypothetical protein